jgi:hypothetical protein
MKRLTTRSIATATAIRDREDFRTSGSLMGESTGGFGRYDRGRLSGPDAEQFLLDCSFIDYIVKSYATPIAWHVSGPDLDRWHVVTQKFSSTTTKHQGNLYLIPREVAKV